MDSSTRKPRDALTKLRAYAYSHGSTLDAIAAALITGGINLDNLQT